MVKWIVTLTTELSKEIEADSKLEAIEAFSEIDARTKQISIKAKRLPGKPTNLSTKV
jgi:hypothetical protein